MIDYTKEIKIILRESSDLTENEMNSVNNDANLADIGIDSLSLIEAIFELEKKFNIEIELSALDGDEIIFTINGINKLVNEKLHG